MVNQVDFLGARVSRLILGDNPVHGHTYIPGIVTEAEMLDFFTEQRVMDAVAEGAASGINTMMPLANEFSFRVIRHYRHTGKPLQVLFQSYPPVDFAVNVRQMAAFNPIGIYHQGTTTDYLCEQGQFSVLRDRIHMIHDAGFPAGIATHVPETILRAEEENWGCDFYAACLHNARKRMGTDMQESAFITGKPKHIKFYPEDRPLMLSVIGRVQKPCVAFKLFAGGQIFYHQSEEGVRSALTDALAETFGAIKPNDVAAIGFFQRDKNQIRENAEIYCKIRLNP